MTDTKTHPSDDPDVPTADARRSCQAWIELYDDAPDVYTIYATERRSVRTTWISAEEGSYVSLNDMR